MRILCCGDRDWTDGTFIHHTLAGLPKDTVIIHGACRGADIAAKIAATRLGLKVIPFPAKWHTYGLAAGPIRNQQMLDEGLPDIVYAFHDNLSESKGTADMIDRASLANIPIKVFTHTYTLKEKLP